MIVSKPLRASILFVCPEEGLEQTKQETCIVWDEHSIQGRQSGSCPVHGAIVCLGRIIKPAGGLWWESSLEAIKPKN